MHSLSVREAREKQLLKQQCLTDGTAKQRNKQLFLCVKSIFYCKELDVQSLMYNLQLSQLRRNPS
jgi:hypothetical protein